MNSPIFPTTQGAWAHGNLLIAAHNASFPRVCIKCGRPAEAEPLEKSFSWHARWIYLFILLALLLYAVLAAATSKRMKLRIPLCAKHLEKYRTLRVAAIVLLLGSLAEMIAAGIYLPESYKPYGIVAGFCALLAGLVCLILFNGLLSVNRIDSSFGYFANASEAFLVHLPPPPPGIMLPR